MNTKQISLAEAIATFDRDKFARQQAAADQERAGILKLVPRDRWPSMKLTDFALGQDENPDNFCVWMEFRTKHMGGIVCR